MGDAIRADLQKCPIFDHHAHNLVGEASSYSYERCFTEAEGEATANVRFTLSFRRSIKDLGALFGCNASYEDVVEGRARLGLEEVTARCFKAANIERLLLDDGLMLDQMHSLSWHRKYVPSVQRVLRIEYVAEELLNNACVRNGWTLEAFDRQFLAALDPLPEDVVAFKSIIAYRSGLDINVRVTKQDAEEGLEANLAVRDEKGRVRVKDKRFLDFVFLRALEVATQYGIPMQLHTGFGDKDLDLRWANPLYLRKLLKDHRFAKSRLVLLHSSYPYMREASHLASIYSQVYVDFGLAVPKLSVQGMLAAVRDLLDLAPANKVMVSTDGYAAPETYFLGAKWSREILSRVLSQAVEDGDLTRQEAVTIGTAILHGNARALYGPAEPGVPEQFQKLQSAEPQQACHLSSRPTAEPQQKQETAVPVKLVRLLFCDAGGQRRCRVVPVERFSSVTASHGLGMAKACIAMPSFIDAPAEGSGLSAVGEIRLMPDLSSRRVLPWCPEHALVLVDMHKAPGEPWEICPRSTLKKVTAQFKEEFGLVARVGTESEFYLLKPTHAQSGQQWAGADSTAYSSSQALDERAALLTRITEALGKLGIEIEQLHAESGPGQFELAVGHKPAEEAADDVLLLRETVVAIAAQDGFRASFIPKYFESECGSGAHLHISLCKGSKNVFAGEAEGSSLHGMSELGGHFVAGLLHHLPALMALTAIHPNSYARIQPNTWSGAYQCWGFDNREAPLRTASPPGQPARVVNNVEYKAIDAMANPHLAIAAILLAGMDGIRSNMTLPDPVDVDSADVTDFPKLPTSLSDAVVALLEDKVLLHGLGAPLTRAIKAVRQAEVAHAKTMDPSQVAELLVLRY